LGNKSLGLMDYPEHWDFYDLEEWFNEVESDPDGLSINENVKLQFHDGKYILEVPLPHSVARDVQSSPSYHLLSSLNLVLTRREMTRLFRAMRSAMYSEDFSEE